MIGAHQFTHGCIAVHEEIVCVFDTHIQLGVHGNLAATNIICILDAIHKYGIITCSHQHRIVEINTL